MLLRLKNAIHILVIGFLIRRFNAVHITGHITWVLRDLKEKKTSIF